MIPLFHYPQADRLTVTIRTIYTVNFRTLCVGSNTKESGLTSDEQFCSVIKEASVKYEMSINEVEDKYNSIEKYIYGLK